MQSISIEVKRALNESSFNFEDIFSHAIQVLDKVGVSVNDEDLKEEYGLKSVTLSQSGNYVKLTGFVVNDKGEGNGTRFMNDLIKVADQKGWILVLTPDASLGGSSVSRLKRFYKRFGFKENKGRNTDFSTRESMIRNPNT